MNKQQTIQVLQNQLPSFYSLEQVINIINSIEDNNNTLSDDLIQAVIKSTRRALDNNSELADRDSAEFELGYDNRIELSCIDVDVDRILDIFEEELDRYVAGPNSDIVELEKGE